MDAVENRFESLQQNIEQFIETMRQVGIMVSDFQPGSQDNLNDKMYAVAFDYVRLPLGQFLNAVVVRPAPDPYLYLHSLFVHTTCTVAWKC